MIRSVISKYSIQFYNSLGIATFFVATLLFLTDLESPSPLSIETTVFLLFSVAYCALRYAARARGRINLPEATPLPSNQGQVMAPKNFRGGKIAHKLSVLLFASVFLGFGMSHLGEFMSVDEPKWVNTRVPQLFQAIATQNWEETYINDKPGVLPSLLSGWVNYVLDRGVFQSDPEIYETYLFWWRLPILVFNFLLLFLIYRFTAQLLTAKHALLTTLFIATSPILIGISQVVNPDATLWSTSFLSFLTFLLYIKENRFKYILYSGVFLGLALISKYFASILYVAFFLIIYLEYFVTKTTVQQFINRCLDVIALYLISITIYIALFPATWGTSEQIFLGTINAEILASGRNYFLAFIALIFFDLFVLRGWINHHIQRFADWRKILLIFLGATIFAFFLILLANILGNNFLLNPDTFLATNYTKHNGGFFATLATSSYVTLLTTTYPVLFGLFLFVFIGLSDRLFKTQGGNIFIVFAALLVTVLFLLGSATGGLVADARYQIILYPLTALIASIGILSIFEKFWRIVLVSLIVSLGILVLSHPFYYLYTNSLNMQGYVLTEAWGFGGYELAQQLNSLPNAKNLTIWSDREGVNEFFVGKSYWRGDTDPFEEKDVDLLILTRGGEIIFRNAVAYGNADSLYYRVGQNIMPSYSAKPVLEFCPTKNDCVRAVQP